MLRLPRRAFDGLALVPHAVEKSLALPTQICVNVVALLGMGKGQSRSLGAYTPFTWPAVKNEMRNWNSEYHGWWDDAVKGNSALQSGLLRRVFRGDCLTKRAISGLHVLRH